MPSLRALSARFSLMPEPGNRRTPIGIASSIWSLRLNGAAFLCRAQSGLNATWGTCRLSAQQGGDALSPLGRAAMHQDHRRVLLARLVEGSPDPISAKVAGLV